MARFWILLLIIVSHSSGWAARLYYSEQTREAMAVSYTVLAPDFPENGVCRFTASSLHGRLAAALVEPTPEGHLVSPNEEEPLLFHMDGVERGEPVLLRLTALRSPHEASLVVIPFPIERTDEKGRAVTLVMVDRYATLYQMRAKGFAPGESLVLKLEVGEEQHVDTLEVRPDGTVGSLLSPSSLGGSGGIARLTLQGTDSQIQLAYHCD